MPTVSGRHTRGRRERDATFRGTGALRSPFVGDAIDLVTLDTATYQNINNAPFSMVNIRATTL